MTTEASDPVEAVEDAALGAAAVDDVRADESRSPEPDADRVTADDLAAGEVPADEVTAADRDGSVLYDPGPAPGPPVPRWIGAVFLVLAALMVPWIIVLWMTLPSRDVAAHYRLAWVGFDVFLALALIRTGWVAWKGRDHVELPAVASATLLLVDAWFDVVTASHRAALVAALVGALLVELPLAALCLWIARNAEQVRRARLTWALRVTPAAARRLGSRP